MIFIPAKLRCDHLACENETDIKLVLGEETIYLDYEQNSRFEKPTFDYELPEHWINGSWRAHEQNLVFCPEHAAEHTPRSKKKI